MDEPEADEPDEPTDDDRAPEDTTADDTTADDDPAATVPHRRGSRRREWIIVVGVAIAVAILVRMFVIEQYRVEGGSMLSTLHDGDRVLVDKLSYRFHDPRRGDVVVLELGDELAHEDLIKRVIGLPGETIEVEDCVVRIDGAVLEEPYLDRDILDREGCGPEIEPMVVPDATVFVLGDHRGASRDSRTFGAVSEDDIIGRARVVIWPFSDWAWL